MATSVVRRFSMRLVIPILLLPLVVPLVLAASLGHHGSTLSWRNAMATSGSVTVSCPSEAASACATLVPRFDEGRPTKAGWRIHPALGRNATGVLRANSAQLEPREGCPSDPSLMQSLTVQNCRFYWFSSDLNHGSHDSGTARPGDAPGLILSHRLEIDQRNVVH